MNGANTGNPTASATRLDVRRAKKGAPLDALRDDATLPAAEPEPRFDPELIAVLPSALSASPPPASWLLRIHYLDELTCPEIAAALEISVGTVKSRPAYGLAAMWKALVNQSDG